MGFVIIPIFQGRNPRSERFISLTELTCGKLSSWKGCAGLSGHHDFNKGKWELNEGRLAGEPGPAAGQS